MNTLGDILHTAWGGISANKLRSALTMLGVIIGVATVVALLSIGAGTRDTITGRITSVGTNLLTVSAGFVGRGPVVGGFGSASLGQSDATALASEGALPDAVLVAPEYSRNTQLIGGGQNTNAQIRGVTPAFAEAYGLSLARGRFPGADEVAGQASVVVLGATVAEDLFGGEDPLGRIVSVSLSGGQGERVPLSVIGVLAAKGGSSRFTDPDEAAFVPLSTAQRRIFGARSATGDPVVSQVTVVAKEGRSDAVAAQIDALLRRRRGLSASDEADFNIASQEDLLELAGDVTGTMTLFLGAIALISLVVGGIGIMNIMLVSVTERTREIGIRKAVGADHRDILLQFLSEAVVLGFTGGLLGALVGVGVAWGIERSGLMHTVVSPASIALALGFSVAVGLLSGLYPANRAGGLNPIDALRYE